MFKNVTLPAVGEYVFVSYVYVAHCLNLCAEMLIQATFNL